MAKTRKTILANGLLLTILAPVLFGSATACGKAAGTGQNEFRGQPEPVISSVNTEADSMEISAIGDVKEGGWGGPGINMLVEKGSATIEFDCGSATISSRIRTAKDGKFTASGLMTQSGPGPVRLGSEPKAREVRFEGKVSGKQMKMTVKFAATGEVVGNYTLEKGRSGRIRSCL